MRLDQVRAALDRRLDPASRAPLAVGFSGGGDSLFLLKTVLDWARPLDRPVLALVVDHQLQPQSAAWTAEAVAKARALGAAALGLTWTDQKPRTGLPAAARRARHALLATAAREAGARVLILGHTASDLAEGVAMRAEGSSVSNPRAWAPSPVWPEGRGLFVLRPLLTLTRAEIRDALTREGETWLDDPANLDLRYARARARAAGALAPPLPLRESPPPGVFEIDPAGAIRLPRDVVPAHLAAALLCASGAERPPRGDRLARLVERLRSGARFTATLAGARIEADQAVLICRDAGEAARGGLARLDLAPGACGVWDGRWEVVAGKTALAVVALRGRTSSLPAEQRARLSAIAPAVRPCLPVLLSLDGDAPGELVLDDLQLEADGEARVRSLVLDRFKAAVGLLDQESVT
ncbi:tRNA lysidine(34) synthetase TilS [Caulobacter vibrioides]|uniref:tRNA lysidine(34) synthetase TilS n=1 Tax=Caulobacter vibrioides TaxID=155892 RepID=UPI000BB477CA|nr:tRNA lysidine(34) synthetase TilS [Caulobacter vibrioides]ATC26110.1 tRNA lysidine(34) synthetase TilS [Caulobacter vibrioides]AZH14249.1 tRNA lysidine(34) synthetase TilS [Caulobacter vibrioides]PLR11036.1 tRNA lysidine(34) synthetase TilS [Caulobacter vibrioides]